MNIKAVPVSFELWFSLGMQMPRNAVDGLFGGSINSFLRRLHTVFRSDCTNVHSHQQCRRIPFSSDPLQDLLFIDMFDNSYSDWCKWYYIVLICIFLIISDVEHLFLCFLAVFGEMSIQVFCPFLGLIVYFWILSYTSYLYILEINPL